MGLIWDHVVRYVYSEIPGFSKENRSSGVYWFPIRNVPATYLFAEFAPTKRFYPLVGVAVPKPGQFQREKGLSLRIALSPQIPDLPKAGSLDIRLFVERALPVKSLLAAWGECRDPLARLIQTANCKVCFGDSLEEHSDIHALDRYHLAKSRKHRVDFVCELPQINVASSITTPVLALAKIYHVIQGLVRGDSTRLTILGAP